MSKTIISIYGTDFLINGEPTYAGMNEQARGLLMNVRMVNTVFDDENPETRPEGFDADENTSRFIASMDEYRNAGLLALTINLQGGLPGYEGAINTAFLSNGDLKPSYLSRVHRVIEAADKRGMVVIVGFFYQRQDQALADEDAVRRGTVNAAQWLSDQGYGNVMIEIANEYVHSGFTHDIIRTHDGEAELIELARKTAPHLLVSTSGIGDVRFHDTVARAGDFCLIHGNGTDPEHYSERIDALRRYEKPIIFNEDWGFPDDPRGVGDVLEKCRESLNAGVSWGIMNEMRNQYYPFVFGIGDPDEGENARLEYETYRMIAEFVGAD